MTKLINESSSNRTYRTRGGWAEGFKGCLENPVRLQTEPTGLPGAQANSLCYNMNKKKDGHCREGGARLVFQGI